MTQRQQTLLRWRARAAVRPLQVATCPWCATPLCFRNLEPDHETKIHRRDECPLCGWYFSKYVWLAKTTGLFEGIYTSPILRVFDAPVPDGPLARVTERLGQAGVGRPRLDRPAVHDLIEEIGRHERVDLRAAYRGPPDAADALILCAGGHPELIEFDARPSQPLTVRRVRALVGMRLDWTERTARLVTTTDVAALGRGPIEDLMRDGYDINLADAEDFLRVLDLYDPEAPSLGVLTEADREEIVRRNR
jgi:hypothetical protein